MNERRERRRQRRQELAKQRARARGYNPRRPRPQQRVPAGPTEEEERLSVYFYIETMQEVKEGRGTVLRHVPNLVVAATDTGDLQHWYGPHCIREFVTWLDTLLGGEEEEEDDDDHEVQDPKGKITVVAYNFQGYDSYFVILEYHRQARNLTQIRNGGTSMDSTQDRVS